jgi:hypothetical protein
MQYIISIDPGYRHLGLSVISARSSHDIKVLYLNIVDLQSTLIRNEKKKKGKSGCTGDWDTMKLKIALDEAFMKIPDGANTHCVIELQGVMKHVGSIGIHEVIGACKMYCELRIGKNIVRVPARNKMTRFGIQTGLKRITRKNMATEKAVAWLNETDQEERFANIITENKKRDDICDSLLQGITFAESIDFKNIGRKKAKTSQINVIEID